MKRDEKNHKKVDIMIKNKIKPSAYLYPMPTTIVGANVKGEPNFLPFPFVEIFNINHQC